jgi:hypothetical protein
MQQGLAIANPLGSDATRACHCQTHLRFSVWLRPSAPVCPMPRRDDVLLSGGAHIDFRSQTPTVDSCRGKRNSGGQTGDDTRHNHGVHGVLTDNHAHASPQAAAPEAAPRRNRTGRTGPATGNRPHRNRRAAEGIQRPRIWKQAAPQSAARTVSHQRLNFEPIPDGLCCFVLFLMSRSADQL